MASSKMGRNPFGQKKAQMHTAEPEAKPVPKKKKAPRQTDSILEKPETLEPRSAGISAGQAVQALIGTALDQVTVTLPIRLASVAAETGKRVLSLVVRR